MVQAPVMTGGWTQCPACGLKHSPRADGCCPRCRKVLGAPAAAAASGPSAAPPSRPAAPTSAAAPGLAASAAAPSAYGLPAAPPATPSAPPSAPEPEGFREALAAFRAPPKRRALLWLGVASAIAFVVVALLDVKLGVALLFAAVLLFHEVGHWLAMRLSGQQDVRIFFIPFFGAVTTARSLPPTAGARAAIALAGPIPGIVLGLILLKLFPQAGLGRGTALILLYVNVFNLLPIGFLDGGRVVSSLFLARLPVLEGAFSVASIFPMAFLFGGKNMAGIAGGMVAGVGMAAFRRYRVALEAEPLRALLAGQRDAQALSDDAVRSLHAGARRVAEKVKAIKKPDQVAAVMRELFEEATAPHPTAPERVGYGFAWAAALALGWVTLAEAGVKLLS